MKLTEFDRLEIKIWSSFLKLTAGFQKSKLIGVARVVALPITFFSTAISGILSAYFNAFNLDLFLANAMGLILAHASSNVFNDIWDYKKGIDSPEYFRNIYSTHAVYSFGERKALALGFLLAGGALLCGIYLTYYRGLTIIILALIGFLFIFSYSGPPFYLKHKGLGEPTVFLVWGPIMICGGFYAITGFIDPIAILVSIPYGITASLVLFGKHLDKIKEDSAKGVRTLPVILGEQSTKKVSKILIAISYALVFLIFLTIKKYGILITYISLPRAIKAIQGLDLQKPDSLDGVPEFYPKNFWPMWYVGGAFILNFDFGLTYSLGLALSIFF